jgi:hypothetical protein
VDYRGHAFDLPEFPGGGAPAATLPPPELGAHTLELLRSLGLDDRTLDTLVSRGDVKVAADGDFAWAPVRRAD